MNIKKIRLFIRELYIKHVPYFIREKLQLIKTDSHIKLRSNILNHFKTNYYDGLDVEKQEIIKFIKHQKDLPVFPYEFTKKYNPHKVKVYCNETNGFKYVIHNNKKLYFKKKWNEVFIQTYYNSLLIEQDKLSPHYYFNESFTVNNDEVVADIGAAEGNFSLDIIDKAKHIYMIEADEEWIEALHLTFQPWIKKITIWNKFVSDNDEGEHASLNTIMSGQEIDFMKVDIEGSETNMLKGSSLLLKNHKIKKMVICTYHKEDDYDCINKILKFHGYTTAPSKGFMIYKHDKNIKPPYLRRGLIRANLNQNQKNFNSEIN